MEWINEVLSVMNWGAVAGIATVVGTGISIISSIRSIESKIESRAVEDRARSDARFAIVETRLQAFEARIDQLYVMFIDLLKERK